MADAKKDPRITTPIGRLINGSLFTRQSYTNPETGAVGNAKYTVEIAFDSSVDLEGLKDDLYNAAVAKWGDAGADAFDNDDIILPFKDGDKMAADREKKKKQGDAYKGMTVIRAGTTFNKDGNASDGGIAVYGPNTDAIEPVNQGEVYNGCMGCAGVTVGTYTVEDPKTKEKLKALMFYLVAFQKTGEGEKLITSQDHSTLFEPVARSEGDSASEGEGGRRRKRKG